MTADLPRGIERWSELTAPVRVSTSRSGLTKQMSLAALRLVTPAVVGNYGCGAKWLERVAGQLDAPNGPVVVAATRGGRFAAVSVLRPKGRRRLKLATFFVSPPWRGRRLGTSLVRQVTIGAFDAGYEEVVLTCPGGMHSQFDRILVPGGFQCVARLEDRYGERSESVFLAAA